MLASLGLASLGLARLGLACLAAAVLGAWLLAAPAAGHTGLERGDPGPGESAAAGLTEITLTFGRLAADAEHTVTVKDDAGADRARGVELLSDSTLRVSVEPLRVGVHKIDYSVTFADGHVSTGGYYLEVLPAGEAERRANASQTRAVIGLAVTAGVAAITYVLVRRRQVAIRANSTQGGQIDADSDG